MTIIGPFIVINALCRAEATYCVQYQGLIIQRFDTPSAAVQWATKELVSMKLEGVDVRAYPHPNIPGGFLPVYWPTTTHHSRERRRVDAGL